MGSFCVCFHKMLNRNECNKKMIFYAYGKGTLKYANKANHNEMNRRFLAYTFLLPFPLKYCVYFPLPPCKFLS